MATEADGGRDARAALAWYVTGTLDAEERARVEAALAASPAARAEAAWLAAVKRDIGATVAIPAGDLGLARLMQRIAVERASAQGKVVALAPRVRRLRIALAAAATIVAAQAAVLGWLVHERADYAPLEAPAAAGALLQVTFKPAATEADIRAALAAAGAEIVAGPGALGVYTLRVAPGRESEAADALARESRAVESVSVLRR